MRRFLRLIGMRKGNASRSKGRIGSRKEKRAANKAARQLEDTYGGLYTPKSEILMNFCKEHNIDYVAVVMTKHVADEMFPDIYVEKENEHLDRLA